MTTKSDKLQKTYRSFPKVFKPQNNPVLNALIQGFSGEDAEILTQLENTKAQLFVRTAEGQYLNKLAASRGVARPTALGLTDTEFQNLIPNLSFKAKQIRRTFYDTMDVFWGPLFSRANVAAVNAAPYNISAGDEFKIAIDNGEPQTVKVLTSDVATPGSATITEIQTILNRIQGLTTTIKDDPSTGFQYIVCYTNTPGMKGAIDILSSSGFGSSKVNIIVNKYELWQQAQRSIVYEIRPNELVIEIPAVVPALRRTLRGSHHFHADATLEGPVAPAMGIWQGSFLFDPSGSQASFSTTSQAAEIQEVINKGSIYTKVTVDSTASFIAPEGYLIFGWGTNHQELPVKYRGIPNTNTVLLDPSYVFKFTHEVGTSINVLNSQLPFEGAKDGSDLAIYLTSPSGARTIVQSLLRTLEAAGIIINFVVLAPKYKYLISNPYLLEQDV